MKFYYWLIKQSLLLDFKLLGSSKWSFSDYVTFLRIKYYLILKHFFKKFTLGKDYTILFGDRIYYDSRFGLAGYQRQLATNQKLIAMARIKNVKTVVDVGANVGFFSLMIRNLFPKAKIYSFEPVPKVYSCLHLNLEKDERAKAYNFAVTNKTGKGKMLFDEQNSAVSKITSNGNVTVNMVALDDFTSKNNILKVDILKIDTEGHESQVLEAAKKTLSITKYLMIEINLERNPNYTLSSLLSLLYSKKYEYQLIAFRNLEGTTEGRVHSFDFLMKNLKIT